MSRLHFKPMLEAMDERIVPDATPLAPMEATTAEAAPDLGVARPHEGMTDGAITDRIAEIEAQLVVLNAQAATVRDSIRDADARIAVLNAAIAAATTPEEVNTWRLLRLQEGLGRTDLLTQLGRITAQIDALNNELSALKWEEIFRRPDYRPELPSDPIYT